MAVAAAIYAKSVIKRVESRPRQILGFAQPAGDFEKTNKTQNAMADASGE